MIARNNIFKGLGVALVTPFKKDKSIDYESFEKLINNIIENGADYLVVLGTTAETPSLSIDERRDIRKFVAKINASRLPLVIGMGSNNTAALCDELTSENLDGYSAILSVTPFYNKPTQEGLYQHFANVSKASPLPIILYNVPGRTGVNMNADTTLRLAYDFPEKIISIKEASGNISQIEKILWNKPDSFDVISGDDGLTYPLMTLGAIGVISVLGNALPYEMSSLVHLSLDQKYEDALVHHVNLSELFKLIFEDGNPAGVKSAMHAKGMIENELRLPLVPVRKETSEKIQLAIEPFIN